jgi:DNA-binding XRE family transcriptional regulator
MATGEKVMQIRIAKGVSRKELANQVGVTESMIGQIERGTKALTVPLAKEIATVLECSISDF